MTLRISNTKSKRILFPASILAFTDDGNSDAFNSPVLAELFDSVHEVFREDDVFPHRLVDRTGVRVPV